MVLANRTAAEPTSGLGVQHFVTSMVRGAQRGLSRLGHLGLYAIAGLSYFYWPGIWAPQGYRCKLVANIQTACSRFKHTVGEVVGGYPTYRLAGEGGQETLEKKVGFPAGRWPDPEAWHLRSDRAAARRIPGSAVRHPFGERSAHIANPCLARWRKHGYTCNPKVGQRAPPRGIVKSVEGILPFDCCIDSLRYRNLMP